MQKHSSPSSCWGRSERTKSGWMSYGHSGMQKQSTILTMTTTLPPAVDTRAARATTTTSPDHFKYVMGSEYSIFPEMLIAFRPSYSAGNLCERARGTHKYTFANLPGTEGPMGGVCVCTQSSEMKHIHTKIRAHTKSTSEITTIWPWAGSGWLAGWPAVADAKRFSFTLSFYLRSALQRPLRVHSESHKIVGCGIRAFRVRSDATHSCKRFSRELAHCGSEFMLT